MILLAASATGWHVWGKQADNYDITWETYKNNSNGKVVPFRKKTVKDAPEQHELVMREKRAAYTGRVKNKVIR